MKPEINTVTAETVQTGGDQAVVQKRLVRRCVTHHFGCDCREARFRELLEDTIRAHSTPDNGNYNECDKDPCAWCEEAKALIYHGHPDGVIPAAEEQ